MEPNPWIQGMKAWADPRDVLPTFLVKHTDCEVWQPDFESGPPSITSLSMLIYAGLHPAGLQALYLPSLKTEGRDQSQQQRHQWFNGWGILHVWNKVLEWHPTVCSRWWAGHGSSLRFRGEKEVTGQRGNWHQVGSLVTRETSRGALSSLLLW